MRLEKKDLRRCPESHRLRRASTRQSRHALARTERIRGRPLSAGRQGRTGSDAPELRQEHRDLHDMGTFDSAITATRRGARMPPPGLLPPRIFARARVGHGSHNVISDQKPRVSFRSKQKTDLAAATQLFKGGRDSHSVMVFFPLPVVGPSAWWRPLPEPT